MNDLLARVRVRAGDDREGRIPYARVGMRAGWVTEGEGYEVAVRIRAPVTKGNVDVGECSPVPYEWCCVGVPETRCADWRWGRDGDGNDADAMR